MGKPNLGPTIEAMPAPIPRVRRFPVAACALSAWLASTGGWRCGVGTGTVRFIDDLGTVHVRWDNGSTLGLIPGEDEWQEAHQTHAHYKETSR